MNETSKVKVDYRYIGTRALFNIDILIILKPIPLRRSRHADEGTGSGCHWNRKPPFEEQPEVTEGHTSADIPSPNGHRHQSQDDRLWKQSPRRRNTSALTEYTYKDTKAGESDHICYSEHLVIQKSNNNVPFLDYKETKAKNEGR